MSLLRSTKFVRYFTGAARTLLINSAKTAETNVFNNHRLLGATNSIFLKDYSTSKKSERLEPLLQRLDSEVRRYGRITKRDIDEVFDEIRVKNDITSSQSLLVIRCCGELVPEELPEQRTLLVQKIWNVLTERGVPMDVSHYNALLRVYLENEHPFSPAQFLEEMEKKGLQPNRVTYQRLMWRYCQEGDVDGATKVLEKMRELNMPVSEQVLNALVMGHAFHGDTEGAKAVLETMAGAGLKPSNQTFALLACGYAKHGDIAGIENVIAMAEDKDSYLTDKDLLDVIEHLANGGHKDKVEQILSHLRKGAGFNQDICNLILRLLNKGHDDTAKLMLSIMSKSNNVEDTMFKGAFYVKQLVKLNRPTNLVIASCRELQDEGLIPKALYIAAEVALQQGRVELARTLLRELKKDGMEMRQHYYWPILAQKGKEGDEEGLIQTIREMCDENLIPSGEALRDYILPYLIEKDTPQNVIVKLQIANVPVAHCARNLITELLYMGNISQAAQIALQYRPRGGFSLISGSLVNALNKTKDIESFVKIVHVLSVSPPLQTDEDSPESSTGDISNDVGPIIKSAIKNLKTPELCETLLEAILSRGIKISERSAEEIEQYLGNNMTTNISQLLLKLTSPDLECVPIENSKLNNVNRKLKSKDLEQIIKKTIEKGGNITRLQKQLLVAYIDENNVEKLESYIEELRKSNFDITTSTQLKIFECYAENDNIEKADEELKNIISKDPEFVLSRYKKIVLAHALVRANRYEEAIQFLKDNKPTDDNSPTFLLNSKCWQMLNTLVDQKDVTKVKELTEVLINNNYILPTNVLLGPMIKVHIVNDDLESALNEFEYCCKQYRSTPWKGELMKTLIMKESANKLQWLADLSTQIHGEINILHDLVLAFVECGRLRQARRILETPGLLTRQRRLNDACERYVEEGKSEYLEGLLEATRDLSVVDRSNIFYHLLVTYCKANETDKALGLWTVLQEEGEIPSEQFLVTLGNYLKSKKIEVPFIIPEEKTAKNKVKTSIVAKEKLTPKQPEKPTKQDLTNQLEKMINDGHLTRAVEFAIICIKKGNKPRSSILKYLLKQLAMEGNVEAVEQFGKCLDDDMKKDVTYNDKHTLAVFKKGNGEQHIDNLLVAIEKCENNDDLKIALKAFPRSTALASAVNNEELAKKCQRITEIAASKGALLPANLLWLEYLIAGKNIEAESIWNNCLKDSEIIVYRRLLQEAHLKRDFKLIEALLSYLKRNPKIQPSALGNVYSRYINLHLVDNNIDEAKSLLDQALRSGIQNEHLNKSSLSRLKEKLEAAGKDFEYSF
ncbi:leucine-rich PPR motif-containing protein, mitochondrial [Leptidea sinapis]|uniref:leucine-rich PPR motif-containing protein, mitochondrial n=1 Tax=Leptidea sinapis TaxID=189913 RepID=UPI002138AED0|nr:leucine-rich PPR motif-containing protein, mitochondrial [Leptidea sinapis]